MGIGVLVAACHDPACDAVSEAPRVEVGAGWESFQPLADGDLVEVEHGFQGGSHVFGALHAWGIVQDATRNPGIPRVTFQIVHGGDAIGGFTNVRTAFQTVADGVLEALAQQAIFADEVDPGDLLGETVTLRAEIVDKCGTTASGDVDVQLADSDTGF